MVPIVGEAPAGPLITAEYNTEGYPLFAASSGTAVLWEVLFVRVAR